MDLRLALRSLLRRPGFTLAAVLTLAVGMGVNAAAFTILNALFVKRADGRGVEGGGWVVPMPSIEDTTLALDEYRRYAEATRGRLTTAAEGRLAMTWRHEGATETAWAMMVSSDYFPLLDPLPLVGRVAVAPGRGGPASAVVGERFWRERLGAPSLAGLTLHLNGVEVGVAGVLPLSFRGPGGLYAPDVWLPLDDLHLFRVSPRLATPDARWLAMIGRLAPGASAAEVDARLAAAAAEAAREHGDRDGKRGVRFMPFSDRPGELRALAAPAAIAMGIIGLVMLIACFNVANLLLARAVERERDLGIRAALGASAWRQVRLVTVEGLVIAGLSGALALLVAWWTQALAGAFAIPIEMPQYLDVTPDLTVVAFIALLVAVCGVAPGLLPAMAAARVDVMRVLGSQGGGSIGGRPSRLGRWLVAAQVAGSTAFLIVAALLARSYAGLASADTGFDREHVVAAEFDPGAHGYDATRARQLAEALAARAAALPGVVRVALADRAPFFIGFDRQTAVAPAAAGCPDGRCPSVGTIAAGPGYFAALGLPLVAGRDMTAGAADEVVINQPLARLLWPDGRGVGESIRLGDEARAATVVGITAAARLRALDREPPMLYEPIAPAHFEGALTLVARTDSAPSRLVRPLREAAAEVDADVAMGSVKTMEARMAVLLWPYRTVSALFGICGLLALGLATSGLAGVVAHAAGRRTREFGVRLAVGAAPRELAADVLRGSALLLLPGLGVGIVAAAAAARLLSSALVGVSALSPAAYVAAALVELAVAAAACLAPALRAARTDPLIALRSE